MTDAPTDTVGRKVADGARLMITLRIAERLVGLASFSILARFLTPADFGLLALATSVIAVVELFGQAGVNLALIQRRSASRDEYDTAWTIDVIVGVVVAGIVAASAAALAVVLHEPRVERILYWLAAASAIGGLQNIGIIDFQKSFQFGKELRLRISTRTLKAITTIAFALLWRDYWALVAGYVAGMLVTVVLTYAMHPYRPRFTLSAIRAFTHFSGWMLVRNISTGLSDHLVNLLIGRAVSVSGLAYFSAARELADMATTELQAPIRRAMFPGFAAVSHDAALLRRSYVAWTAVMVLLTFPIPIGLALVADDVVRVLLGERWLPVVALLQILACAGIFRASVAGSQLMLIAMGQPRLAAAVAVLRAVVVIPLVVMGTALADATGAAWAMFAMAALMFGVNLGVVIGAVRVSRTELFDASWRPAVATLVMAAVVLAMAPLLPGNGSFAGAILRLVVEAVVGLGTYAAALGLLWSLAGRPAGAESHALEFVRPLLERAGDRYFARR